MSNQLTKTTLSKDWANFKEGKTIYVDKQRHAFLKDNGFVKGEGKNVKLKAQNGKSIGLRLMKDQD